MMKAGTYWIGDLCYVMHDEWDEVCNITISGHSVKDGEFKLADGREFATYCTAYGDGMYSDQDGNVYGVDGRSACDRGVGESLREGRSGGRRHDRNRGIGAGGQGAETSDNTGRVRGDIALRWRG